MSNDLLKNTYEAVCNRYTIFVILFAAVCVCIIFLVCVLNDHFKSAFAMVAVLGLGLFLSEGWMDNYTEDVSERVVELALESNAEFWGYGVQLDDSTMSDWQQTVYSGIYDPEDNSLQLFETPRFKRQSFVIADVIVPERNELCER